MRPFTFLATALVTVLLAACTGKGADYALVTDQGEAELKQSLDTAARDMSPTEARAFLWALESVSLADIRSAYPNASPRTIYRAVAADIVREAPDELARLEADRARFDGLIGELKKIEAEVTGFTLEDSFHSLKPTISATVRNGSALDVSLMRWRASLFIDGQKEPVAVAELTDSYNERNSLSRGGLRAGSTAARQFTVGFVTGDPAWTTLAVQNARTRRVVMMPIYSGVTDFNNLAFLDGAPYERIESLKGRLETARQVAAL